MGTGLTQSYYDIECPHCREKVKIPDHYEFYDAGYEFWEIKEKCPKCYEEIVITEDSLCHYKS